MAAVSEFTATSKRRRLALVKPHQLHIAGAGGKASAWGEWLQPLLSQAIQAAPLEFSSLWACCVRFAVHTLTTERCGKALGALLDSISAPIPQGELFHVVIFGGHLLCLVARHRSFPMNVGTLCCIEFPCNTAHPEAGTVTPRTNSW